MTVDTKRIRVLNDSPLREKSEYVLYWSQMNRRAASNHALAHAVELANELHLPVLFYEGLTCSYPGANDRLHTFILEGVPDTAAALNKLGIGYVFYPRKGRSDPNDVLYKLAAKAAAVVTDDYPVFIAAEHNARVPGRIGTRYVAVDSSCVVPPRCLEKREWAAYTIRPKIAKLLPGYLRPLDMPRPRRRWSNPVPRVHREISRQNIPRLVAQCDINHAIRPSTAYGGGSAEAAKRLTQFLAASLANYAEQRNQPSAHVTSEMSPYLHFGHISALQIALAVTAYAADQALSAAEYLEELIVRRELAFNFATFCDQPDSLDSLPQWAKKTLSEHARDRREPEYSAEQMELAATGDVLWNAAQKELLLRGKIHGYYRMYWGKKIIEWSRTYEDALRLMIDLHERYALDGRDPNTYTNILWCFGLHDRPWQERPIFGQVRFMSYEGMKRKTDTAAYIAEIDRLEKTGEDPLKLV